jgi:hypothetical protein
VFGGGPRVDVGVFAVDCAEQAVAGLEAFLSSAEPDLFGCQV